MKPGLWLAVGVVLFLMLNIAALPASLIATEPAVLRFSQLVRPSDPVTKLLAPVILPDGRWLVTAGNSLYMLNADGSIGWKYSPGVNGVILQPPIYRPDLNEIAFVATFQTFQRLNATNGVLLWQDHTSGKAEYADLQAYGDGYVTVQNMESYRGSGGIEVPDRVVYWNTDPGDVGWTTPFPIGAKLVVIGTKIYSAILHEGQVVLQPIAIPKDR